MDKQRGRGRGKGERKGEKGRKVRKREEGGKGKGEGGGKEGARREEKVEKTTVNKFLRPSRTVLLHHLTTLQLEQTMVSLLLSYSYYLVAKNWGNKDWVQD